MKNNIKAVQKNLKYNGWKYMLISYALFSPVGQYMLGATTAEAKWKSVMDFITPWISRLGGVVMLIGGIMFGLGFKDDDAESKAKGVKTLIAGAIVIAVGLSSSTFLY